MKTYSLKVELLSPALVGSGEGYGAIIDSDVVFDEVGLPYIPAKRIKGCLLDSAREVKEMFEKAGISFDIFFPRVFGDQGAAGSAPVYFSNLYIESYRENKAWLEYYLTEGKYKQILSKDSILETFTEIRQQTRITDDGVASEHSLRSSRVIKKGVIFVGDVTAEDDSGEVIDTLALAVLNFRSFGTARNRGFGEIRCFLMDGVNEISVQKKLEDLCTS
jgi:CRISPR/Cas system CSM-associated protein Csm3 (group 7 of RAMP superfamily)